jgi:hypothetical protein
MIDLKRLETGGNAFSATYVGSTDDFLLIPLAPFSDDFFDETPIRVHFISDEKAIILPECDVCTSLGGVLNKVFK